jgi:EAL domain-containing protein (putative c-di-GMP-specific phosphodiesterase class I)
VFEITESALMQDSQKALEAMLILKQKGCRIYMDDFGTGYSSLSYLKRFPIDVLKIDQSFVADIGQDASDEAIIHSTLALAHSLGKSCVAEGVETKAQVEFLQMLGCDYLQGYLFSKPVPSNEVSNLLDCNWLSYYQD